MELLFMHQIVEGKIMMGNVFIQPTSANNWFYDVVGKEQKTSKMKSSLQFLEMKVDKH